jgi:hypothetical protein
VFDRFNSLIADFVALFIGFISLFRRIGNLLSYLFNINSLEVGDRSLYGSEAAVSQYFPGEQGFPGKSS